MRVALNDRLGKPRFPAKCSGHHVAAFSVVSSFFLLPASLTAVAPPAKYIPAPLAVLVALGEGLDCDVLATLWLGRRGLFFVWSALPEAGSQEKDAGRCAERSDVVTGACS